VESPGLRFELRVSADGVVVRGDQGSPYRVPSRTLAFGDFHKSNRVKTVCRELNQPPRRGELP
jgi:hypothetical protein